MKNNMKNKCQCFFSLNTVNAYRSCKSITYVYKITSNLVIVVQNAITCSKRIVLRFVRDSISYFFNHYVGDIAI